MCDFGDPRVSADLVSIAPDGAAYSDCPNRFPGHPNGHAAAQTGGAWDIRHRRAERVAPCTGCLEGGVPSRREGQCGIRLPLTQLDRVGPRALIAKKGL